MAKQIKAVSKPVIEEPVEKATPVVVNKPTAEISTEETALVEEVKFIPLSEESVYVAKTIDEISNPVKERIAQLEEMLTRRWSGWRVQKIKRELEDLKSQL